MPKRTIAQLKSRTDQIIKTNNNEEISAALDNSLRKDFIDSTLNIADGGLVVDSETGYSTEFDVTDPKAFVPLKQVEDLIEASAIDAYTKTETDDLLDEKLNIDGSKAMTGNLNVGGNDVNTGGGNVNTGGGNIDVDGGVVDLGIGGTIQEDGNTHTMPSNSGQLINDTSLATELEDYQSKPIVISSNHTAVLDEVYHNVATATYTDPTPSEGKGFTVLVINGTATVGGTGYSTVGTEITRYFHSGSWYNRVDTTGTAFDPTTAQIGDITPANSTIADNDTATLAFGKTQGQIDEIGLLYSNPNNALFNPFVAPVAANAGWVITYDENNGIGTMAGGSGTVSFLSGSEVDIVEIGVSNETTLIICLGLQSDGQVIRTQIKGSNVGRLSRLTNAGSTSSWSSVIATGTNITSDATRVRVVYNSNGNIEVYNNTWQAPNNFTLWGTYTAAAMSSAGYVLTSTNFGYQSGGGGQFTSNIIRYRIKSTGEDVYVGRLYLDTTGYKLFNNLYPFYSKRVVCLGDSITLENNVNPGDYTNKIKSKLKVNAVLRNGVSGTSLGSYSANSSISVDSRMSIVNSYDADVVILMAGINDYIHGVAVGSYTNADIPNTTINPESGTTFTTVGGLRKIITTILSKKPTTKIFVFGPQPRSGGNSTLNSAGLRLIDYSYAMKAVCEYYNVPYFDMKIGLSTNNSFSYYTLDGIHPNGGVGYELYTDYIAKQINNYQFLT